MYRKFDNAGTLTIERQTVHISDDPPTALGTSTGRIAMLEKRTIGTDESEEELVRYIYSNHLQSSALELDEQAEIISYEEFHPYGTTSYQAMNALIKATAKRYRYTGKERDEESGLYYHGARYYIPWLCRWVSVDPINNENYNLTKGYGLEKNIEREFLELTASPYEYCYDNPVRFNDPDGEQVAGTLRVNPNRATNRINARLASRGGLGINANGRLVPLRVSRPNMPRGPLNIGPAGFKPSPYYTPKPGIQPGSMLRPAPSLPPPQPIIYVDAAYVAPSPVYQSPEQKFRNFAQNLNGRNSAPFISFEEKKNYETGKNNDTKLPPPQRITTDISKLSAMEIMQIQIRIATGDATEQDKIYASQIEVERIASLKLNIPNVDEFMNEQQSRINQKLGKKLGKGELPFGVGKEGFNQAIESIRNTLKHPSEVTGIISQEHLRGNYDLIHVYSQTTGNTESIGK